MAGLKTLWFNFVWSSRTLLVAFAFTFLFIFIPGYAFSNSSSFYDKDASTILPIENKNIVMTKEVVRIRPSQSDDYGWRADCEFTFYNKGESEELVTMGYPDWLNGLFTPDTIDINTKEAFWNFFDSLPAETKKNYMESIFVTGYGYDFIYFEGYKKGKVPYVASAWNLHDLEVFVDGKRMEARHKPIDMVIQAKTRFQKEFAGEANPSEAAYVWKLPFKPRETRTVKVSFSFEGLRDAGGYQEATYLLRTGALWADKIGDADIYWDIKGRKIDLKKVFPKGFEYKDNVLHWKFKDFEPSEDISIYMDLWLGS